MENHMRDSPQWDHSSEKIIILPKQFYQLMIKHSISEAIGTVLIEIIAVCEAVCMPGLERECQITWEVLLFPPCQSEGLKSGLGANTFTCRAILTPWRHSWLQIFQFNFKGIKGENPWLYMKREAFSIYCGHFSKQVQKKMLSDRTQHMDDQKRGFYALDMTNGQSN